MESSHTNASLTNSWRNDRTGAPAPDPVSSASIGVEAFLSLGEAMLDTLRRVGYGGILLDDAGDVLRINDTGRNLLRQKCGDEGARSDPEWLRSAVRQLTRAATPWFPRDAKVWLTLPCDGERPLALQRIPLYQANGGCEYFVIVLADLAGRPQPNPLTLKRIFGLTGAEAKLAIRIGHGDTPSEIARDHGVSVATVRSQLASVFAKTQTRRQTDLALLLMRAAMLP